MPCLTLEQSARGSKTNGAGGNVTISTFSTLWHQIQAFVNLALSQSATVIDSTRWTNAVTLSCPHSYYLTVRRI